MPLSIGDLATTTLEYRSKDIADNVSNSSALLAILKQQGRIQPVDGGRTILEPMSVAENPNGGWYSGYDPLPLMASDVLSSAEFAWKQYAVPVVISGLEEMQNSGESALYDLLEERIKVAETTMVNDISEGLYGDGTASGGRAITGLEAAVPTDPTTGTYGGINRATYTFWRPQVLDPVTTPTAATIGAHMTALWISLTRGKDKPNLIVSDNTLYAMYMASLQPLQRFTDTNMAGLGFENVKFMSAPVVNDGGIGGYATASTMWFLNTRYLKYRPHKRRDMVPIGRKRVSVNQDASVEILGWMGNLTCSGQKFQGRLIGT